MSATLNSALVADLAGEVSGSVLGPQDAGYEAARAVHNGLIDRRPALIVRCRTACDVSSALAFARQAGAEVSIRGGGHNGYRGVHPRRRPGLAHGQVRACRRQLARGRARHGRGRRTPRRRGVTPRSLLGAPGRRRELRRRDVVHLPPALLADGRGRTDRPIRSRLRRPAALLPRCSGGLPGRPDRVRRAGARTGRLRREAFGLGRLPHRRRR
jgi:hypothetical protein